MTLHRRGRKAVAAAFALSLLVAACGGDDDSPDDPPESTTTTAPADDSTTTAGDEEEPTESTEPEEEGPDVEEAQALAESINLTIDDFADGWEAEPADEDDDDDGIEDCFQDVDIDAVEVAQADSPTFTLSSDDGARGQVVQTSTIVVDEEASAEDVIAEIGTNQFAGCAEDALIASVEEGGGEITDSGIDVVEDQGGLGDEAIGLAGAITFVGGDGTEASGQLALYFIRTENVVTGVQILDIGDVAFEDTLADLLAAVAERQAANV